MGGPKEARGHYGSEEGEDAGHVISRCRQVKASPASPRRWTSSRPSSPSTAKVNLPSAQQQQYHLPTCTNTALFAWLSEAFINHIITHLPKQQQNTTKKLTRCLEAMALGYIPFSFESLSSCNLILPWKYSNVLCGLYCEESSVASNKRTWRWIKIGLTLVLLVCQGLKAGQALACTVFCNFVSSTKFFLSSIPTCILAYQARALRTTICTLAS